MKDTVDKKIIGFDMDGVIINHASRKVLLAKQLGFKIKKNDTPSEILKSLIPRLQYEQLQCQLYDDPKTSLLSPLMPGVKNILAKIKDRKIPFYLISRRKSYKPSKELLVSHNLWPRYFNDKNTYFVKEIEDKETKAKALGITHYIDDEQKVLNALASVKNKFLFDPLRVHKNSPYEKFSSWKEAIIKLL